MRTQTTALRRDGRPAGLTDGKGREAQEGLLAERARGRVERGAQCIEDRLQGTSQKARSRAPGQCYCCRNVRCQSCLTAEAPPSFNQLPPWGHHAARAPGARCTKYRAGGACPSPAKMVNDTRESGLQQHFNGGVCQKRDDPHDFFRERKAYLGAVSRYTATGNALD